MILLFGLIFIGFVLGVVTVVAAEALGLWLIIKRLSTKIKQDEAKNSLKSEPGGGELDPQQSLSFAFNKQVNFLCLNRFAVNHRDSMLGFKAKRV